MDTDNNTNNETNIFIADMDTYLLLFGSLRTRCCGKKQYHILGDNNAKCRF